MSDRKQLREILLKTADRLSNEAARYQWGHMGQCNVGHVVQTMTGMKDVEIVKSLSFEMDEWSEHAKTYCEGTNLEVNDLFETLKKFGLSTKDIVHLENLSDKRVLENLPGGFRYLARNQKKDLIEYLNSLAEIVETP